MLKGILVSARLIPSSCASEPRNTCEADISSIYDNEIDFTSIVIDALSIFTGLKITFQSDWTRKKLTKMINLAIYNQLYPTIKFTSEH